MWDTKPDPSVLILSRTNLTRCRFAGGGEVIDGCHASRLGKMLRSRNGPKRWFFTVVVRWWWWWFFWGPAVHWSITELFINIYWSKAFENIEIKKIWFTLEHIIYTHKHILSSHVWCIFQLWSAGAWSSYCLILWTKCFEQDLHPIRPSSSFYSLTKSLFIITISFSLRFADHRNSAKTITDC